MGLGEGASAGGEGGASGGPAWRFSSPVVRTACMPQQSSAIVLSVTSNAASALHRTPTLPLPAPAMRDNAKRSAHAAQGVVACKLCEH